MRQSDKPSSKLTTQIKNALLSTASQMFEIKQLSTTKTIAILTFESIYILSLFYSPKFTLPWYPTIIYSKVFYWLNYIRAPFIIKIHGNLTTYIVVLSIFCIATFLIWILTLLEMFLNNSGKRKLVTGKLLMYAYIYAFPFILYEGSSLLIYAYKCSDTGGLEILSTSEMLCGSFGHQVLIGISTVILILMMSELFMIAAFMYDICLSDTNALSRISINYDLLLDTIMIILYSALSGSLNIILILACFGINTLKLIYNMMFIPYNNRNILNFQVGFQAILWLSTFCLFLGYVLGTVFQHTISLFIIGSPFVAYIALYYKRNLDNLSNIEEKSLSPMMYLLKLRETLLLIFHYTMRSNYITLSGHSLIHYKQCKNEKCKFHMSLDSIYRKGVLQNDNKDKDKEIGIESENMEEYLQIYTKLAKQLFLNMMKAYPSNVLIKLYYSKFLQVYHKKIIKSLFQLESLEKQEGLGLITQYAIKKCKASVSKQLTEEKMISNKISFANIENAIESQQLEDSVKESTYKTALAFDDMWNYLKSEDIKDSKLESLCIASYDTLRAVEVTWDKIINSNSQSSQLLSFMSQYQQKVLNDYPMFVQLQKKAKQEEQMKLHSAKFKFNDMANIKEYAYDGVACFYISATKDKLGTILQCNMSACQLFGYPKYSLINQNIKMLLPNIIAKNHDDALRSALGKDINQFNKHSDFLSYANHVSGYTFPAMVTVRKLVALNFNGDQFVGKVVSPKFMIDNTDHFLLLDKKMRIVGLSQSILIRRFDF